MLTGERLKELQEVKDNPGAHKEFIRLNKLLRNIGKNDAIYEQTINRYCLLVAECNDFAIKREQFCRDLEELTEDRGAFVEADEISKYYKTKNDMQKNIVCLDKQLQSKRKMLLDMEKENIMTIASALRSIPKKQEKHTNELLKALGGSG